jgi:hypothetical protein
MYTFYSSSDEHSQRVTVVGEYYHNGLQIATSICNKKDLFFRKKGRTIASGRLYKGKLHSIHYPSQQDGKTFVEIAKKVVSEVLETKMPVSARFM